MAAKEKTPLELKYEKYSRRAERVALLIIVGLVVEIVGVFVLGKELLESVITISANALIALGVWGELILEKIARTAGDGVVAEANSRAEEARLATETLRAENLRLQAALQPREIVLMSRNGDGEVRAARFAAVQQYAGTQVAIRAVPDFEPKRLAGKIAGALQWKGWNVTPIELVPPERIREGVTIVTLDERLSKPSPPDDLAQQVEIPAPAKALLELLQLDLGPPYGPMLPFGVKWTATFPPFSRFTLGDFIPPANTIVVLVGMKPMATAFVGPPPQQAPPATISK